MKNYFLLYLDSQELISNLTDKEAGQLLKAFYTYTSTGEIPKLSRSLNLVFLSFKQQLDRDLEAYEKKCLQNKINGSLGGRPRKNKEVEEKPNGFDKKPFGFENNQMDNLETQKSQEKQKQKMISENINNITTHARVREYLDRAKELLPVQQRVLCNLHGREVANALEEVYDLLIENCQESAEFAQKLIDSDDTFLQRCAVAFVENGVVDKRTYLYEACMNAKRIR